LLIIKQKNNLVQTISIKCGLVYEGKKFKDTSKKLYYPGEIIFQIFILNNYHFVNILQGKITDQLLVRPIEIYEVFSSKF
jgi:hypothetical protein